MNFCVCYKNNGWTLKPTGIWKEMDEDNEVNVVGVSNSDYSKEIETSRSVTGYIVFLNKAPLALICSRNILWYLVKIQPEKVKRKI
jgi:hypothetical protein